MARSRCDRVDPWERVADSRPPHGQGLSIWQSEMLIPMKSVSDSDLIPVTRSDPMPVKIGAQRRWRSYRA